MGWALWVLLVVASALVLDRLLLAAEARGWIYWRRRKASSSSSVANAFQTIQAFWEPSKAHSVEERQRMELDEAEDDDPEDPEARR